jgi:hypothetical protein
MIIRQATPEPNLTVYGISLFCFTISITPASVTADGFILHQNTTE